MVEPGRVDREVSCPVCTRCYLRPNGVCDFGGPFLGYRLPTGQVVSRDYFLTGPAHQ